MHRNSSGDSAMLKIDAKINSILSRFSTADLQIWASTKNAGEQVDRLFRNTKLFESELLSVTDDRTDDCQRKSIALAEQLRKLGNDLFAKSRYAESIKKYNLAIRNSPLNSKQDQFCDSDGDLGERIENKTVPSKERSLTSSKELALAFGNRSAALFHLKRFEESIGDVCYALYFSYPMETRYKLYERRAKSWLQLGRRDAAETDAVEALRLVELNVTDEKTKYRLINSLESFRQKCHCPGNETKSKESFLSTEKCDHTLRSKGLEESKIKGEGSYSCNKTNIVEGCKDLECLCHPLRGMLKNCHSPIACHPPKPEFSSLCDAVDVRHSELVGRYTVSKHDIRVGKVIAMEKPFSAVLYSDCYDTHCYSCFREILLPFPCLTCSDVVFCGLQCYRSAWREYHWAECGWMDRLTFDYVGRIGHLAYRILVEAGYENVRTVFGSELSDSKDKINPEVLHNGASDGGSVSSTYVQNDSEKTNSYYERERASEYRKLLSNLVRHETSRSPADNLALCAIALVLVKISKITGWMPHALGGSTNSVVDGVFEVEKVIFTVILSHLQFIQCNAFEITEMRPVKGPSESTTDPNSNMLQTHRISCIGLGIYQNLATMNHSCDPSVDLVFYGSKSVVRAIRNISSAEEITIDYGHLFFLDEKSKRRSSLLDSYYFECGCRACIEDWPLWDSLPDTNLTLNCSGCRAPFKAAAAKECSACRNPVDSQLTDAAERLEASRAKYGMAMSELAPGLEQRTAEVVEDYLSTMQDLICLPWKDFCLCQATLRQLYRLMANRSSAEKA